MRVLICGGRDYTNKKRIEDYVFELPAPSIGGWDTIVITGGAKGADTLAYNAARFAGLATMEFPAQWNRFARPTGKNPAGMIRNQRMLDEGKPDLVVYFHDDIESSKGTKDMVARARKAGIKVLGNPTA